MTIPILMYHHISVPPRERVPFRNMQVDPRSFARQMRLLHLLGYKGLSMRDLMPYIKGEKHGKVFGITFDDGFRNVLENALPILQRYDFTSTNYFVANQIGGGNVWDAKFNAAFAPCMDHEEVKAWHDAGQEVGAHTLDHVHLPQTEPDEARRQISQSRIALENIIGEPVTSFCYPYGENNVDHRHMTRDAGFTNAVTTQRRKAAASDDPYGLPRITVRRKFALLKFTYRFYFS